MKFFALAVGVLCVGKLWAQAPADTDPQLLRDIRAIRAVDNHTHVPKVVRAGEAPDDDYDALPVPESVVFELPVFMRPEQNPMFIQAEKALYGYPYDDLSPAHIKELDALKQKVQREQGERYPVWVLDKLGIEVMVANRIAMGAGLTGPRFRWVSYEDALMYPLNNAELQARSPVDDFLFKRINALLARYLKDENVVLPKSLDEYLSKVVVPTIERQKRAGAIGIKFEMAYLRSLETQKVAREDAGRIYAKYVGGGVPKAEDYTRLQDFLFRYMVKEAGRLGLAVHIHTGGGGTYNFNLYWGDPVRLDSVLNSPEFRNITFVLLHGDGPNSQNVGYLLSKKNVFTDFSFLDQALPARPLAAVLRQWIEQYPEKVMFGTDLGPDNWEEQGWVATENAREALALALTGMMRDGEITRERALEVARMIMRENAIKLYAIH